MKRFSVEAAAIDLDGTLLDTLPDIADAARRMLGELGRPPAEDGTVRACIGDGVARLVKHVARCFGVEPARLLMIGDSDNDTRAARAAGCPVLCVPYGYRGAGEVRELDCDAIVPDLLHVRALITSNRS